MDDFSSLKSMELTTALELQRVFFADATVSGSADEAKCAQRKINLITSELKRRAEGGE